MSFANNASQIEMIDNYSNVTNCVLARRTRCIAVSSGLEDDKSKGKLLIKTHLLNSFLVDFEAEAINNEHFSQTTSTTLHLETRKTGGESQGKD